MEEDIKDNDQIGTLSYPVSLLYSDSHGLDNTHHHLFSAKGDSIGTILFGASFIPDKKEVIPAKKEEEPSAKAIKEEPQKKDEVKAAVAEIKEKTSVDPKAAPERLKEEGDDKEPERPSIINQKPEVKPTV